MFFGRNEVFLMVAISVVIPVYNVEDFLGECLDSIINQTFKDIEIICVNDGSSDKSLEILNEYASKDDRITVLDQENGGHAVATNRGINLAKGKYLFLMDSDDILHLDALEHTYKVAEERDVDFVIFQAINYFMDKDEYVEAENYSMNALADYVGDSVFNWKDIKDYIFSITVTPWSKLYNREFIVSNNIKFPEGLVFDDNVFFYDVLFAAERITFLREHLFARRWYSSSSTTAGGKTFLDYIPICNLIWDVFKKYDVFDEFKKELYIKKVNTINFWYNGIKEDLKQEFFEKVKADYLKLSEDKEFYDNFLSDLNPNQRLIFDSVIESNYYREFNYRLRTKKNKNKNKYKVSVVIPVYNAEKYLEESLNSIFNQTLDEIEIVCVDDGSEDNSLKMLNDFAAAHENMKVFHQENKGGGAARNYALGHVRGKYTYFMDADDELDLNALKEFYELSEEKNLDLLIFQAVNYNEDTDTYYDINLYLMNDIYEIVGENIFSFDDLGDKIFRVNVTPWCKFYNTEFILSTGSEFAEGLIFHDNVFHWGIVFKAKRIYFYKKKLYKRRRHSKSSTGAGDKRFVSTLTIHNLITKRFIENNRFDKYKHILYNRKLELVFVRYRDIQDQYKDYFYGKMKEDFSKMILHEKYSEFMYYVEEFHKNKFDAVIYSNDFEEFKLLLKNAELKNEISSLNQRLNKLEKQNNDLINSI